MKTSGYMLTCDRCGAQHFVKMIEEREREASGGWEKWMEHEFEDKPDGWGVARIGESLDKFDLCPKCNDELKRIAAEFMPSQYS